MRKLKLLLISTIILICYFLLIPDVQADEIVMDDLVTVPDKNPSIKLFIVMTAFLLLTGYVLVRIYSANLLPELQENITMNNILQAQVDIYIHNLHSQVNNLLILEAGDNLDFELTPVIAMKVVLQAINENTTNTLSWLPLPLTNPTVNQQTFETLIKTLVMLENQTNDESMKHAFFLYNVGHLTIIDFLAFNLPLESLITHYSTGPLYDTVVARCSHIAAQLLNPASPEFPWGDICPKQSKQYVPLHLGAELTQSDFKGFRP